MATTALVHPAAAAALAPAAVNTATTIQTPNSALTPKQQKVKEACQQFEAIFLRYLLQKMRDTVPKDGLLGSSQAQETYQDLMDGALADSLSKNGQFGLGEMLYKQLSMSTAGANTSPAAPQSKGSGGEAKSSLAYSPGLKAAQ